jgi:uncharacterized protein (DUF4415 family)
MKGLTDWKRVEAMTEEDIERAAASDPDAPMTTAADWANARVVWPAGKQPICIDNDIVEWFRKQGHGYQSRINSTLREFVKTQKPRRKTTRRAIVKAHPASR